MSIDLGKLAGHVDQLVHDPSVPATKYSDVCNAINIVIPFIERTVDAGTIKGMKGIAMRAAVPIFKEIATHLCGSL